MRMRKFGRSKEVSKVKTFIKTPCIRCGAMVSNAGFAYTAHDRKCRNQPPLTPVEKLEKIAGDLESLSDYETSKRIRAVIVELKK